jgi:hypothetical protein
MAEDRHDISSVHHLPVGKLICYARAVIAFEECARRGGNIQQCAERLREAIAHCNAPDAADAGGGAGGGGTGTGGGSGGGGAGGGTGGGAGGAVGGGSNS